MVKFEKSNEALRRSHAGVKHISFSPQTRMDEIVFLFGLDHVVPNFQGEKILSQVFSKQLKSSNHLLT